MRIGIDVRLWNQTGVGTYIRNLVGNLERIDKKNTYILFARDKDRVEIKNSNFKTVGANFKWHGISEQLQFVKLLNKENLNIIHFTYPSAPVLYKKPFLVTVHDLIPLHFQTGEASTLPFPFYKFKFAAYKFIISKVAKNSKKIIVPSNVTKEDVIKYLKIPSSKIEVIYEGVDDVLRSKEILKKENFILYVGNAYPHKNLNVILDALKTSHSDYKLILVGREDYFYRKLKQNVKKMNLNERVLFQAFAKEEELASLYKRANALIIPSFLEGFGLPGLEAMANGCLVIASDIPVLHEVYGDAAIYFNPKDSNDLSNKLEELKTGRYKDKAGKGIERVKKFSWEKTARETLKLYKLSLKIDSV